MPESNVTRGYGFLERLLAVLRFKMANRLIPPSSRSGRILDIGCGTSPFFLRNVDFSEKFGLDKIDRNSRDHAGMPDVVFVNHDLELDPRIPSDSDRFDVVTMLAVFEHIEPRHLPGLVNEIHRVLKPGGCFIMTTPARWTDGILRMMAKVKMVSPEEIAEHKDTYTPAKISSILGQTAFTQTNVRLGYFELFMNIWMRATK